MTDPDSQRHPRTAAYGDPRAVVMRWAVPPDQHGRDAVWVLSQKVRRLGAERARSVIEAGDFRVGRPGASASTTPSTTLARGTPVEVWRLPPDAPEDIRAEPRVLHIGDGLVVLDKPGDLAVHPSARYLHATVTGWLTRRGTPANPAHRLDRETSGVLVCATDVVVERRWKKAFAAGEVEKAYVAVVEGVLESARTIALPLAVQGDRGLVRIKMVVDDSGQEAVTEVEPLAVSTTTRRTLVRCRPRTGRQHQLRAHLAAVGLPIVGDKLYQMGEAWFDAFTRRTLSEAQRAAVTAPRQCLHAERVACAGVEFAAPTPALFEAVLAGDVSRR